jgi:flavorubredoxin
VLGRSRQRLDASYYFKAWLNKKDTEEQQVEIPMVRPEIYFVGAIDWDRRLFDALIPLPHGTSYNSYLIRGRDKTVLIDTVNPDMESVLIGHIKQLGVTEIDYVVANHAEQDHSGALPAVLEEYPAAKVIATPRCKTMLEDLLLIPEDKFVTVDDHEEISLGNKTLEFVYMPWVHWPETMVTYLKEDRILFTCDFFGSHLATSDLYVTDEGQVHEAARRYYAEIMMPFHTNIEKNLEKLQSYAVDVIAPSHGPMYNNPEFILKMYHAWVFDEPKNIVVVPYVSMHGSTKLMVNYFVEALVQRRITVKQFDLASADIGQLAMALVDAATIVIGTPTVLSGPHPTVAYAALLANALRPRLKYASIIGSFLWGGRAVDVLNSLLPNLKVEILEPVIVKGLPKGDTYAALDKLAETIAERHKSLPMPSSWHIS